MRSFQEVLDDAPPEVRAMMGEAPDEYRQALKDFASEPMSEESERLAHEWRHALQSDTTKEESDEVMERWVRTLSPAQLSAFGRIVRLAAKQQPH